MPFMTWNDQLSVGVEALDNDHKKMVSMVNILYDGIVAGRGNEALQMIMDDLVAYTGYHFTREEDYFALTGYAEASEHKIEHDVMKERVKEIQLHYKDLSPVLTMGVMVFLKDWLIEHILGSDKRYGPHLNGKGFF